MNQHNLLDKPPLYYRSIIAAIAPLYRTFVWYRSHNNHNYKQEVADRFGARYKNQQEKNSITNTINASQTKTDGLYNQHLIWCHAVSLGETNTIAPIIHLLLDKGYKIWLTNTTQTGFARVEEIFSPQIASGDVQHSYVPIDKSGVINSFLQNIKPCAALFVETELWATTLYQLACKDIPSILVNARLSETSYKKYKKYQKLSDSLMHNLSLIIAQDAETAKRYRQLGAEPKNIRVAGSLKWVSNQTNTIDENKFNTYKGILANKKVWVAASTHQGEEAVVLDTHKQLLQQTQKDILLIIVPRHPERFDDVAKLLADSGMNHCRLSTEQMPTQNTQVFLADSMGELDLWYKLADFAFVGGSIVNIGGHNPIEAYLQHTPVIMGPYTKSCPSVIEDLLKAKVMIQLPESYQHKNNKRLSNKAKEKVLNSLLESVKKLINQPKATQQMANAGYQLAMDKQLILQAQFDIITDTIEQNIERKHQLLLDYSEEGI